MMFFIQLPCGSRYPNIFSIMNCKHPCLPTIVHTSSLVHILCPVDFCQCFTAIFTQTMSGVHLESLVMKLPKYLINNIDRAICYLYYCFTVYILGKCYCFDIIYIYSRLFIFLNDIL